MQRSLCLCSKIYSKHVFFTLAVVSSQCIMRKCDLSSLFLLSFQCNLILLLFFVAVFSCRFSLLVCRSDSWLNFHFEFILKRNYNSFVLVLIYLKIFSRFQCHESFSKNVDNFFASQFEWRFCFCVDWNVQNFITTLKTDFEIKKSIENKWTRKLCANFNFTNLPQNKVNENLNKNSKCNFQIFNL